MEIHPLASTSDAQTPHAVARYYSTTALPCDQQAHETPACTGQVIQMSAMVW